MTIVIIVAKRTNIAKRRGTVGEARVTVEKVRGNKIYEYMISMV